MYERLPSRMILSSGTPDSENINLNSVRKSFEENFEQSRARSDDAKAEPLPRKALTEILIEGTIQSLLQQKPEISHVSSTDITG